MTNFPEMAAIYKQTKWGAVRLRFDLTHQKFLFRIGPGNWTNCGRVEKNVAKFSAELLPRAGKKIEFIFWACS
jgi:hypothetical protein